MWERGSGAVTRSTSLALSSRAGAGAALLTTSGATTAMPTATTTPQALATSLRVMRLMRSRASATGWDAAVLHQAGHRRGVAPGVCAQRSVRSGERPLRI